jgi:hypothetical protein
MNQPEHFGLTDQFFCVSADSRDLLLFSQLQEAIAKKTAWRAAELPHRMCGPVGSGESMQLDPAMSTSNFKTFLVDQYRQACRYFSQEKGNSRRQSIAATSFLKSTCAGQMSPRGGAPGTSSMISAWPACGRAGPQAGAARVGATGRGRGSQG